MAFQYATLRPEYSHEIDIGAVASPAAAARFLVAAQRIIKYKDRYQAAAQRTGIPALWFMVINERESGTNFRTYLGNGDPLSHVTTHVPKGRGPFATWEDGATDATTYDHVGLPGPDKLGWTWPWFLYRCEAWNGFGPRMHGRETGYLWAGTNIYDGGKYVADGVWDESANDTQLGVFGLARALVELDPSLEFDPYAKFATPWGDVNGKTKAPEFKPVKDDVALTGVRWIQDSLNKVQGADLLVDGSYGRHTRAQVRLFQKLHNLNVDGIVGNLTCAALDAALAEMPKLTARPKADSSATVSDAATVSKVATSVIDHSIPATPDSTTKPKGPHMDFTNLMNLAGMVAPQFAPALASSNPLLPVAINVLGDALGLSAPHTADSVSTGAAGAPADVIAAALKKAATDYAKHVNAAASPVMSPVTVTVSPEPVQTPVQTAPAASPDVKQTGGVYVSTTVTNVLHAFTWAGGMLLSTGLLDPAGPLAGLAKGSPLLGVLLTVGGPLLNYLVVSASNKATETAINK